MKTDIYTKAVLTVIAACLCINLFKQAEFIPKATAGNPAVFNSPVKYGLVPLNPDGSINVKFSETMKVELDRVNCTVPVKATELMNVKIKEVDSWAFNSCALPVKPSSSSDVFNMKIKEVDGNAFYYTTLQVKVKQ